MTTPPVTVSPRSGKIYEWALETVFEGLVDTVVVARASAQWELTRRKVWFLNATAATFDGPAVMAIPPMLARLKLEGLDRVALLLPARLKDRVPYVLSMVKNFPPLYAKYPAVDPFDTREQVVRWLQLGCRYDDR